MGEREDGRIDAARWRDTPRNVYRWWHRCTDCGTGLCGKCSRPRKPTDEEPR